MAPSTAAIQLQNEEKPRPKWLFPNRQKANSRALCILKSIGLFLLPSFLVAPFRPSHPALYRTSPRPTAYLDGLRGVAALIVYIYHFAIQWRLDLVHGYGTPALSPNNQIIQAVPFRLLISGRASVTTFFVISGYVLSTRCLRQIYKKDPNILSSLSGAIIRRPFRLYLPIMAVSAFLAVLVQLPGAGVYFYAHDPVTNGGVPPIAPTASGQFLHWLNSVSMLVYPFRSYLLRGDRRPPGHMVEYIGPLWTIPTEFKGSIVVFCLLLAFSRARWRWLRMGVVFFMGVVWQAMRLDFDIGLFCAGMLLAELHLAVPVAKWIAQYQQKNGQWRRTGGFALHVLHHVVATAAFLFAVHLLCFPEKLPELAPGFRTLSAWTPPLYAGGGASAIQWFWISVGAALLVASLVFAPAVRMPSQRMIPSDARPLPVDERQPPKPLPAARPSWDEMPLLQWPFTTRFAQYLGTVSYSLYLMHECVDHNIGTHWSNLGYVMWRAWDSQLVTGMTPDEFDAFDADWKSSYRPVVFKGWVVNTIALIWVSDIVTRIVDLPSIKLTRKVSSWIEVPNEEEKL